MAIRRASAILVGVWLLAPPAPVAAQPASGPPSAPGPNHAELQSRARKHYAKGSALIQNGLWQAALGELEAAYRLANEPAYVFLMGQCHENLGRKARARELYRAYRGAVTDPASVQRVDERIAALESGREVSLKATTGARPDGAQVAPDAPRAASLDGVAQALDGDPGAPGRDRPPLLPGPAAATATEDPAGLFREQPPAPRASVLARWWFWAAAAAIVLGGGAAVYVWQR